MGDYADAYTDEQEDLYFDHLAGHVSFPCDYCQYCEEEEKAEKNKANAKTKRNIEVTHERRNQSKR